MNRVELKDKALKVWRRHRARNTSVTQSERDIMVQAYWDNALPRDPEYNVSQWVEDGCPAFA